jgi:hypothetical protein
MTEDVAPEISRRQAAIVAGIGLLLMTVLAPFANFYVLPSLTVPGDAAATFDRIAASQGLFRTGIATFLIVAILDVIVAWALYYLLKPVDRSLSLLAAWFRVVYAAMFGIALGSLMQVLQLVSGAGFLKAFQTDQLSAQVMLALGTFDQAWALGLVPFGWHLLLLGYLAFKSDLMPRVLLRVLGILLIIAAVGYVVDGLGKILLPDYSANIAGYTFVGEPLFMLWLLWRGIKGFGGTQSAQDVRGQQATR